MLWNSGGRSWAASRFCGHAVPVRDHTGHPLFVFLEYRYTIRVDAVPRSTRADRRCAGDIWKNKIGKEALKRITKVLGRGDSKSPVVDQGPQQSTVLRVVISFSLPA
jgi:hypothetical protein